MPALLRTRRTLRSIAVASVLASVLPGAALLGGCFRGAKVEVTKEYLLEQGIYRSLAYAREPYLVEVGACTAEIACRTYLDERPRLRLAPFGPSITQAWRSQAAPLDDLERARLGEAERPAQAFDHRVVLAGLAPSTTYHVILTARSAGGGGHGEVAPDAREVRFRTLPDPAAALAAADAERVSFLVLGDSGTGSAEQLAVARAIEDSLARGSAIAAGVDFVIHTGDLVYERGEAADYDPCVFAPYRALLARAPLYGVLGNHDVRSSSGAPFLAAFASDAVRERGFWRRRLGPVDLIALDSTEPVDYEDEPDGGPRGGDLRDQASAQRRWLRAALQQQKAPWRFVVLHHPALSAGARHGAARYQGAAETEAMRMALHEAFGRADFILQGHDHHYERSIPLDPAWIDPESGEIAIPLDARGKGLDLDSPADAESVRLGGRTVAILQGTGGGRLADTEVLRAAYALVWGLTPWLGSPFWLSYQPIGFDWVDTDFPWVERGGVTYGVSRFDVDRDRARLRTWAIEGTGHPRLVDDVTYTR